MRGITLDMTTRKNKARKTNKPDAYAVVTETILAALREGTAPWRMTWKTLGAQRSVHGRAYRGANAMVLAWVAMAKGYSDPRWITFRQAKKSGGHVRKGEKSVPVMFWKWIEKRDDETGEVKRFPIARMFRVFNVEQCDELDLPALKAAEAREHSPLEACEAIVAGYVDGPSIAHGGDRACYSPADDAVRMPNPERFDSAEAYYTTLFHELGHSTGHADRLGRPGVTDPIQFGSHAYSQEELVAEMTAAFLSADAGIVDETIDNSAAYCQSWLRKLENDPKMLVQAAQQAQKAADRIMGRDPQAATEAA